LREKAARLIGTGGSPHPARQEGEVD